MRKVSVPEAGVSTLFGAYDDNLRQLESLLNVRIRTQGHDLMIEGDAANTAKVARLVEQLGELITQGHSISTKDVKTAAQLITEYGDLETLLECAGEIKQEKRRQTLIENAGNARISQKLVTLDRSEEHTSELQSH